MSQRKSILHHLNIENLEDECIDLDDCDSS
jgi:hypothetical protein